MTAVAALGALPLLAPPAEVSADAVVPSTTKTTAKSTLGDKTAWATGLRAPQGMTRDAAGNVYVAEYNGGQIAKFSPSGKLLSHIGKDLKSPAWVERVGDTIYISERKANRVLKINKNGTLSPVAPAIEEPLGMTLTRNNTLVVVSHTTSRLLGLQASRKGTSAKGTSAALHSWLTLYAASTGQGKRYGYRCVAVDKDGTTFITDEVEGQVLMLTPGGRVAVWAAGLEDPTAVVIAPNGDVFVAEEGAGRVSRLSAEGVPTVVAEGLGQARDIEFLDARTFLVSDRESGTIWRVRLP